MAQPIVSVIIPVYNGEKYILRAIKSILLQPQSREIEIIVVDDGSVDNTATICDKVSFQHPSVKVIHQENGGVAKARNHGIDQANGKYLAFLDSDDWWSEGFFDKELCDVLKFSNVDLFSFGYADISFDFKYITEYPVDNETVLKDDRIDVNEIGSKYPYYPSWTLFYRRDFILSNGLRLFPVKYNEDFSFSHRCIALAKNITYFDKILYNVYSNSGSAMHGKNQLLLYNEHCKALNYMKKWYQDNGYGSLEISVSILNIFSQTLPFICAYNRFQDVLSSEPEALNHSELYCNQLSRESYLRLAKYTNKKRLFWIKRRLFFRVFWDLVHVIWKCKVLHSLFNTVYYSFRHRDKVGSDISEYIRRISDVV